MLEASGNETILDRVRAHAAANAGRVAFRFLSFPASAAGPLGRADETALTYGELLDRVTALGGALRARFAPGNRVVLAFPTGSDYVVALFACIAARLLAVPVKPANTARSGPATERFRRIVSDCTPVTILTTANIRELGWLNTTGVPVAALEDFTPDSQPLEPPTPEDVAFLQYTSGSTAAPRGVVIKHRNLAANESTIAANSGYTPNDVMCGWLPLTHDFGLVGGILQPAFTGFPSVLLAPEAFAAEPIRWLRAVSDYRATSTGAPNFAFDLCVKRITEEQKTSLNLSSLRLLKNGAEPVRATTLAAFTAAFAACGFREEAWFPCYGLAEATLLVSGGPPGPPRVLRADAAALEAGEVRDAAPGVAVRTLPACGHVGVGVEVVAVGVQGNSPLPPRRVGELLVRSESVAPGYWGKDSPSADSPFGHRLADGREPFLRTGDLGFVDNGEVFITGRLKDLLIIRGRNIYPQDIEAVAEEVAGTEPNSVVAFPVDEGGEEQVGVALEATRGMWREITNAETGAAMLAERTRKVRAAIVNGFDTRPAVFAVMKPGSFPRTTSGKVQRGECRKLVLNPNPGTVRVHREPMHADSTARAQELIEWFRDFAATRLNSQLADDRRMFPPSVLLELGNRGAFGLQVSPEFGGLGLTTLDLMRVARQFAAVDATLYLMLGIHNGLGLIPLLKFGEPELRRKLLPALASGRELIALAISEDAAGSDPTGITTTAEERNGTWVIRGEKRWIGLGGWARWVVVLAKALDEFGRPLGMTVFLVDAQSPGVKVGPESRTLGMRAVVQNRLAFEGVRVPDSYRLGAIGGGWDVAQSATTFGRLGIAAASGGVLRRCAQLGLRYATRRTIGSSRLLDQAVTRTRLSDMASAAVALDALTNTVAARVDGSVETPPELFAVCKAAGPELAFEAVDRLMQLLGGRGYEETSGVPQLFRDVRLFRIVEGATEPLLATLGMWAIQPDAPPAQWLRHGLGDEATAPRLADALAELRSQAQGSYTETRFTRQWTAHQAGRLVVDAFLLAATRATGDVVATAWAHERFEQTAIEARRECSEGSRYAANAITARIETFATDIGDIDQSLPGEEWDRDALLAVEEQAIPSAPPRNHPQARNTRDMPRPDAAVPSDYARLVRELLPRRGVSVTDATTFAELGMESLERAELVMGLAKRTGVALGPDLVHEMGTVGELIAHLERQKRS